MKDTQNLLNYNVWSGTEYYENITGFNHKAISTNNWSSIGERSICIKRQDDIYENYITEHYMQLPVGNYMFTFDIYSLETSGSIVLVVGENEKIIVSYSPNIQHIAVQVLNNNFMGFRLTSWNKGTDVYFTNFEVVKV